MKISVNSKDQPKTKRVDEIKLLSYDYFHICHFFSEKIKKLNEMDKQGNSKEVNCV